MRTPAKWTILLLSLFVFAGCSEKESDDSASKNAPAREQPSQARTPEGTRATPSATATPAESSQTRPAPARPDAAERSTPDTASPAAAKVPRVEPGQSEFKRPGSSDSAPVATIGSTPQKPSAQASRTPKDVVVLTGSPMGGVRFDHKQHVARANNNCATCHHPSKPEKPLASPQQACTDCHTKVATPPMKTKLQAAFHSPTAQGGTCISCHTKQNANGKKAPVKCTECHKKENK